MTLSTMAGSPPHKLYGTPSPVEAKQKRSSPRTTGASQTGLRHFSMRVCRKVEEKQNTTYSEVADELVKEIFLERAMDPNAKFDEKNIRRRVYDAINVLMAMDIISRDKKDICWKGLPQKMPHDLDMLDKERKLRQKEVERKREALRELVVQRVCFSNLVAHNQQREEEDFEERIPLPFIVVNTNQSAVIQCEMSSDRTDVMLDFSMPFEINDDNTILKHLGMDKMSMDSLQEMLPDGLFYYCQEHGLLDNVVNDQSTANDHAQIPLYAATYPKDSSREHYEV